MNYLNLRAHRHYVIKINAVMSSCTQRQKPAIWERSRSHANQFWKEKYRDTLMMTHFGYKAFQNVRCCAMRLVHWLKQNHVTFLMHINKYIFKKKKSILFICISCPDSLNFILMADKLGSHQHNNAMTAHIS